MGSVVNGLKIRIYKKKLKNDRVRAKNNTLQYLVKFVK